MLYTKDTAGMGDSGQSLGHLALSPVIWAYCQSVSPVIEALYTKDTGKGMGDSGQLAGRIICHQEAGFPLESAVIHGGRDRPWQGEVSDKQGGSWAGSAAISSRP
jgi:hypothetical protein